MLWMGCLTVRFCLVPPEPCANICGYLIWASRPETTGLNCALPHCTCYALLTDPLQCNKKTNRAPSTHVGRAAQYGPALASSCPRPGTEPPAKLAITMYLKRTTPESHVFGRHLPWPHRWTRAAVFGRACRNSLVVPASVRMTFTVALAMGRKLR